MRYSPRVTSCPWGRGSVAGVRFRPKRPGDDKYPNTTVAGIRLTVTDRDAYDPTATAVTMMAVIRAVHPGKLTWTPGQFDRLAGNSVLRLALSGGAQPAAAMEGWPAELQEFVARSQPALIYPRLGGLPASPLPRP